MYFSCLSYIFFQVCNSLSNIYKLGSREKSTNLSELLELCSTEKSANTKPRRGSPICLVASLINVLLDQSSQVTAMSWLVCCKDLQYKNTRDIWWQWLWSRNERHKKKAPFLKSLCVAVLGLWAARVQSGPFLPHNKLIWPTAHLNQSWHFIILSLLCFLHVYLPRPWPCNCGCSVYIKADIIEIVGGP